MAIEEEEGKTPSPSDNTYNKELKAYVKEVEKLLLERYSVSLTDFIARDGVYDNRVDKALNRPLANAFNIGISPERFVLLTAGQYGLWRY